MENDCFYNNGVNWLLTGTMIEKRWLTLCYMIPYFNNQDKDDFRKLSEKEKMLIIIWIFFFSHYVSVLSYINFIIWGKVNLLFSFFLSFWMSKILPLTLSQTTIFRLSPTECIYKQQFWIWWKFSKKVENTVAEREIVCKISPFPIVFSNDMYCRHIINRAYLEKG